MKIMAGTNALRRGTRKPVCRMTTPNTPEAMMEGDTLANHHERLIRSLVDIIVSGFLLEFTSTPSPPPQRTAAPEPQSSPRPAPPPAPALDRRGWPLRSQYPPDRNAAASPPVRARRCNRLPSPYP